ncbi:Uncharacterised protein [Klebsiella variicola]|nr:Uncharacterised protein [Klebsiella variicola]
MTEVRIPASITGAASGSSTLYKRCQPVIPIPSATPDTPDGIDLSPASVPCNTGSMPYSARAMSAGSQPNPSTGTAIASTATGGKVCPIAAMVSTSGRNALPAGRVTATPAPSPTTVAARLDATTSQP